MVGTTGVDEPGGVVRDILGENQVREVREWWKEEWIAE
jgi:hypothetical protein